MRIFPDASIRRDAEDDVDDDDKGGDDRESNVSRGTKSAFSGRGHQSPMECRGESNSQVDFLQVEDINDSLLVERHDMSEPEMEGDGTLAIKRWGSKSERKIAAWILDQGSSSHGIFFFFGTKSGSKIRSSIIPDKAF